MKYIGLFDEKEDIATKEKLDAVEAAIPTKTSQLGNDSGFITNAALTGYAKTTDIPTKTSQLDNDSHYITASEAPVQSVNTKTGEVVLTQDDVGDGTTYVRTHNDFTNVLKTQINTNKDNIAMLDGDVEGLQTDVGTLKTNVSSLQTALTSKQDVIVGAASTITEDNLVADRALISNSSGKVAVSNVTSTELGYLDGVTGNVQTQLNNKLEKAPVISVNSKTGAVQLNASDVSAIPSTLTGTAGQVLTKTADGQEWKDVDIPTALPNPNALKFTGAVTGIYDGSEMVTVDIPSSGGGQVFANDLLAEGTIASGLAAWSTVDTGLTVGDLRTYKSFVILLTGSITGALYYDFGTNIGKVKNAIRFEWEDDAKTILMCDGYSQYTDFFSNSYNASIEYWGANHPWARFDFRTVADSRAINFGNINETTSEVTYQIMGWMK